MNRRKIFLVIILCTVLSACTDQKIVNQICLVHAISFDTVAKGKKTAVLISHFKEQGKTDLEVLHTESKSYLSLPRLNTQTNDPLERGQMRMVLFGKTSAEKGIGTVIHHLLRDPKFSSRLQLGVVERDASELLEITTKTQEPFFLSDMIEQNMRNGNLPLMNLHVSLFNYYGEGRDMFLPYFKIGREGAAGSGGHGEVKIDGLALFRSDRMITEISLKDAFLLKMLIQNSKNGSYTVPLAGKASNNTNNQGEDFILLRSMHSKANYMVNNVHLIPSISIRLKLVTELQNVPDWVDVRSEEQLTRLEKTMGSYLKKEIEKFLSRLKENKVDPVGLGDLIRSRSKNWNAQDFEKIYQEIKTTVSVQVKIANTGSG
ncbi:Ger(x)C family spore germination protein [Paenibacillus sacheonensis]|uniref:Ger(X)C family spore germination protein n=1 Tax=Paenibacillus sacheonensis TaxID=742054 RepID=A0A7X4YJW2_9BACL|nr:Ger(x)C family spore germination protein [Paenibacillus sacheonensis]MBM7563985.1 Ger(x)C family germination protein [Paenibacillus sacheonensis]NBC67675.1 Ger(x)C family spore germination protein [Paenibacillus sacheonensis]